jgi:hypothetical protein
MAANLKASLSPRRVSRGLPSMTERQFDVYLSCRDTLRRLRDASRLQGSPPAARPPADS